MPAVSVVTPAASGTTITAVMSIKPEGKPAVTLGSTPPVVEATAGSWKVSETERPGRKPITFPSAPGLRTVRFEHRVASLNPNRSIESQLTPIREAGETGLRVQFFNGGALLAGWWRVRSVSVIEDLKANDNATSRARVTWDCIEATTVSKVELTKGTIDPDAGGKTTTPSAGVDPTKPHIPGFSDTPGAPDTATGGTFIPAAPKTADPKRPHIPGVNG